MQIIKLQTPIEFLRNIGPGFVKKLKNLGIQTVKDLIWHFPSRYEDFSQIYKIADVEPDQQVTIQGRIEDIKIRRTWRKHFVIVEAVVSDETGEMEVLWFNQPYLVNTLRPGRFVSLSGKATVGEKGIHLVHPSFEFTSPYQEEETRNTGRLVPIYPETRGLTSKGLRFFIQPVLEHLEKIKEWIPKDILKENELPEINSSLRSIHFPQEIEEAENAKQRFVFEDLFLLQLYNLEQKLKLAQEKAPLIKTDIENIKKILNELPFELTLSQKKSLWEIIKDLEKERPMNRLLQGDVGSGKTVIAALAAIIAAKNGYQTAFMAPTEILAAQHFATFKKLFGAIKAASQPVIGLLTSSQGKIFYETDVESDAKKAELQQKISSGEVKIVFGTHSLIQKSINFNQLGLVIIDEQHRFGVKQRAALLANEKTRNSQKELPHFLSMSATPIPRTLMITIFGNLDISLITELPKGRKTIITKIIPPGKKLEAYNFIRNEVKNGRQIFVICPRIEPSQANADKTGGSSFNPRESILWEIKSVKEEYEKLSKKVFPDLKVAMLHGKLKSKEKERIFRDFKNGKIDILVSTSVIEVGVDVPNATIMMIESTERFGLAQLYQFRGRVGRGEHQSYCFLFTDSDSQSTQARLKAISEAKNGFELAEKDLKIRGPGEFLGEKQTGFPDIAMKALQNMESVKTSREAALKILKESPGLNKYPLLKNKLKEFQAKTHFE